MKLKLLGKILNIFGYHYGKNIFFMTLKAILQIEAFSHERGIPHPPASQISFSQILPQICPRSPFTYESFLSALNSNSMHKA